MAIAPTNFFSFPLWPVKRCTQARANQRDTSIQQVAKESLKEFGIALLWSGSVCFFVTSLSSVVTLLVAVIVLVGINTLLRYKTMRSLPFYSKEERQNKKVALYQKIAKNFAIFDEGTRDTLFHEAGHALSSLCLFRRAAPSIVIEPFLGGTTYYFAGTPTFLGQLLGGRRICNLLVTAAGALTSLFFSLVGITIAHFTKETHPQLHEYLKTTSIINILSLVIYAFSALFTSPEQIGHDFLFLWAVGGIHPLASILFLILVPLILKLLLNSITSHTQCISSLRQRVKIDPSLKGLLPSFHCF